MIGELEGTATEAPAQRWRYAIAPSDSSPLFYHLPMRPIEDASRRRSTIVLCDGIGCDGYIWRELLPALSERFVVHPHYRGHGRSSPPPDLSHVGVEDLADDLNAVLADAAVDDAVLVGHSMGIQVALETFRRQRKRVRGLVLLCGAAGQLLKSFKALESAEAILPTLQSLYASLPVVPAIVNRISKAILPTRFAYEVATRTEIRGDLVSFEAFMPYFVGMSRVDTQLFLAMLARVAEHTADPYLSTIDVPTLVVAGGRDGMTPAARSHAMVEAIAGAELLDVPDGSHSAPLERPDLINAAILDFLARRCDRGDATQG